MLRPAGMVSQAEVHIEVKGDMPLKDVEMICLQVEMDIRSHFVELERISIISHSSITESPTVGTVSPSSRLFRRWMPPTREKLHQYRQRQKQEDQPTD